MQKSMSLKYEPASVLVYAPAQIHAIVFAWLVYIGSGFRVYCCVLGSGFRGWGLDFRLQGLGLYGIRV